MRSGKKPSYLMLSFLAALALGLGLAEVSWAKKQDLRFAPGSNAAVVEGAVIRGESDTYLITAKAGQSMTVEIASLEDNAVFALRLPGKGESFLPGAAEGDDASSWRGKLPVSGAYRVIVGPTRGNAHYRLRVEIGN